MLKKFLRRFLFIVLMFMCGWMLYKTDVEKARLYYDLKRGSPYNILNWKKLNEKGNEIFGLNQFVKYHFEFSPEDFENNPDPELGSTIEHLREKILTLSSVLQYRQNSTQMLRKFHQKMFWFSTIRFKKWSKRTTKMYLSKIHIETGNVIDSIILIWFLNES